MTVLISQTQKSISSFSPSKNVSGGNELKNKFHFLAIGYS